MSSILTFAKIAMRNLLSKPVTTTYPFEPAVYPEGSRGHIELNIDECVLCGLCAKCCPTGTIVVDRKAGTWTMNRFDCVQCQNCVNACHKGALTIVPGYFEPGTEKVSETFTKPVPKVPSVPVLSADKCKYCGLCMKKCPNSAITVDRKEKNWTVDSGACVACGLCVENCHFKALEMGTAAPVEPVPVLDGSKCKYCGLCMKKCPNSAIAVDRKAKTWAVSPDACVGCGLCVENCHFKALSLSGS